MRVWRRFFVNKTKASSSIYTDRTCPTAFSTQWIIFSIHWTTKSKARTSTISSYGSTSSWENTLTVRSFKTGILLCYINAFSCSVNGTPSLIYRIYPHIILEIFRKAAHAHTTYKGTPSFESWTCIGRFPTKHFVHLLILVYMGNTNIITIEFIIFSGVFLNISHPFRLHQNLCWSFHNKWALLFSRDPNTITLMLMRLWCITAIAQPNKTRSATKIGHPPHI